MMQDDFVFVFFDFETLELANDSVCAVANVGANEATKMRGIRMKLMHIAFVE